VDNRDVDDRGDAKHLGVVRHSRSGSTDLLCDAAIESARAVTDTATPVEIRVRGAFDAGPDDLDWADALLLATPANFGYMSGALKDFFERIYHPCLGRTDGLAYALIVKGDTDVDGAVASVQKIATGLGWNLVLPPVTVVGAITDADVDRAADLGATLAAGLGEAIF
jgi:multimeric flavodoxin WrbA